MIEHKLTPLSPKLHGPTVYLDAIKRSDPDHADLVEAVRPFQEHVIHAVALSNNFTKGQFFAGIKAKVDPRVAIAIQAFADASGGKVTPEQAARTLLGQ